jgi:BarA-like signal transduction histidine kinase
MISFCNEHAATVKIAEPTFVLVTGFHNVALVSTLKKMNVEHCYAKPISRETLIQILNSSDPEKAVVSSTNQENSP